MLFPRFALLGAAASLALTTPAVAQMNMPGMQMPGMKMPIAKKKAAPKKAGPVKKGAAAKNAKVRAKGTASKKRAAKIPAKHKMSAMPGMEMPGHDMSTMPGMTMPPAQGQQPAQPMPGHDMSTMPGMTMPPAQGQQPAQPMQGHDMSQMPGMEMPPGQTMPGMNMSGMQMPMTAAEAAGTSLPAGNAPAPPVPTDSAADVVYGPAAMADSRHHLHTFHGGQKLFQVLNNVMEYQARHGRDGYQWDSQAWYGGDINRLWLKSEGDGTFRRPVDRAEVQALYSRAINPYFNLQAGLRYDFKPNPSRVYATVGIEGLAPSFFEVEGALFLSNKGEVMARGEAWYDQRITQRLILQPRTELNFAAQTSRSIGVGSGLSDAEIGVRLRYDIRREFAPYVGIQYRRAFGATGRFLREAGEDSAGWEFVAGLRTWF